MSVSLSVLLVEDQPADAELVLRALRQAGFAPEWQRVETEAAYLAALDPSLDMILADYALPQFDALRALELLQARRLDIPFIIVSGTIGDEVAVAAMRQGATDYLIKDRLARLGAAVAHALQRRQLHREKLRADQLLHASEQRFRALIEHSGDGIALVGADGIMHYTSPSTYRILGYAPETLVGQNSRTLLHPDDQAHLLAQLAALAHQPGKRATTQCRVRHADGGWRWLEIAATNMLAEPSVQAIILNYHDITAHKESQERIGRAAARAEALTTVAARLNAQLDLATVLQAVCEATAEALQVPVASVSLFDERRAMLDHAAAVGLPPDIGTCVQPIPRAIYDVDTQLIGEILVIADVQMRADLPNAALYIDLGMRSIASARMLREGQLVGNLTISSVHTLRHFTADDLALLQGLAHQAAQAITNARLYTQAERRLAHVQALRAIDRAITTGRDLQSTLTIVLDQVAAQLHADAAEVLILDAHTQTLATAAGYGFRTVAAEPITWRMGEGQAGRVARERRTVGIANLAAAEADRRTPQVFSEGFVTYYGVPLIANNQLHGILEVFQRAAYTPDPEWLDVLETLAGQAAIAIDNVRLFDSLQRANLDLTLAYDTTIEGWSRALDLRDKETEGHSQRVTVMTLRLATAMGVGAAELVHVRRGALLHDIGKMGVPDGILLKPGPLTDAEMAIMRQHPVYSYDLLAPITYLRPALDIPYCHHEKWDGSGYPRGLAGEQIPLTARIFAVVDVWDAMRSDRPYRKGRPDAEVYAHIRSLAGTHFDPQVVQVFVERVR
jgi:PAS domain S-box-containing protein